MAGGLKATFMASYIHTAIIFVILLTFILLVYTSGEEPLGSPGNVYDALQAVASKVPRMRSGPTTTLSGKLFSTLSVTLHAARSAEAKISFKNFTCNYLSNFCWRRVDARG
mgnify:CR=1 FL=1